MSAPSTTASQTEFCNAMSRVNVTSEPPSGYDTPMLENRISEETLRTLNAVSFKLGQSTSRPDNPNKRKRVDSPNQGEPSTKEKYIDTRDQYSPQAKPVYLKLKGLHKKKLSLAASIKVMEDKLAKNQYPTSVDFRFNINSTRNPILKDAWARAIRTCKTDLTLALIDDLQKAYSRTKATIAKEMAELETFLTRDQFQEIKDSLTSKFKQMAPSLVEKRENQFRNQRGNKAPRKRQFQGPRNQRTGGSRRNDQKMDKILNTLKSLLK